MLLYCHSPAREEKARAIDTAKASGFEAALAKLQASLSLTARDVHWRLTAVVCGTE